jgi:cytochrome b
MAAHDTIKVWDPLLRIFHWSLVIAFTLAYASGEEWQDLHVLAGYTIAGLLGFRLLWGVVGTRHARFSDFVRRPADILGYLKQLLSHRAPRYLGHNPAGGAMVVLLLVSLTATVLTGMGLYAGEEAAGPLAGLIPATHFWEEAFEETHEFFANFTLLLVFVHLAGVAISSLLHRENLVRAMITGRKPKETP